MVKPSVSSIKQLFQTYVPSAETDATTVVVDFDNPVFLDYRQRLIEAGRRVEEYSTEQGLKLSEHVSDLVIFLPDWLSKKALSAQADTILSLVKAYSIRFVTIVSPLQSSFGDPQWIDFEKTILSQLEKLGGRGVIFRCGHIISNHSQVVKNLRRFAFLAPLVPNGLSSCFINGDEVFDAIASEQNSPSRQNRIFTLLGPNRPWQEVLKEHGRNTRWQLILRAICSILSFFLLGHIASFCLNELIHWGLLGQRWNFNILQPPSMKELLSLVNRYNHRYVKVVGYNNGVNHFGYHYPGKTIISTVHCNRIIQTSENTVKVDCGTTIGAAQKFLAAKDKELCAAANYTYISLGTAFFIPIHGSARDYTTVSEAITRVLLYEPTTDRYISTSRDEAAFQHHIYNLNSDFVLLRLYLQVKPKAQYFFTKQELINPSGQCLLDAFSDKTVANIEIRKSKAKGNVVHLQTYHNNPAQTSLDSLELPRDTLGSLWDKLEKNPGTSWFLHAPVRYLLWNVELFLSFEEFLTFWQAHSSLPIFKIELRYVRRDSFPNSPFHHHDCIGVDFLIFRKDRDTLNQYLTRHFPNVPYHTGKHHIES